MDERVTGRGGIRPTCTSDTLCGPFRVVCASRLRIEADLLRKPCYARGNAERRNSGCHCRLKRRGGSQRMESLGDLLEMESHEHDMSSASGSYVVTKLVSLGASSGPSLRLSQPDPQWGIYEHRRAIHASRCRISPAATPRFDREPGKRAMYLPGLAAPSHLTHSHGCV